MRMQIACAVALWVASVMCWQGCRPPAATQSKSVMKEMAFDLMDAWVEGDSLHAVVRYGGGCKAHFFRLQKDGPMLKSLPPKQPVRWVHRSELDPCRALIVDTVHADITPFRGTPHGSTFLILTGWDLPLTYSYP